MYLPSITLNNSIAGPLAAQNLRVLTQVVAETGERQMTHKVADVYADIPQQTWDLQGVFANLQAARHLGTFYTQQSLFLKAYSASLEGIRETLKAFTEQAYNATSFSPGVNERLPIVKEGMRRTLEGLVNLLNGYDENYGYIFSGAQVDQKPVNTQIIPDINNPFGPYLSLGTIPNYFLNGNTPKAQNPLILYAENGKVCVLPLRANDFQYALEVIYDFLSLPLDATSEQVRLFTQAMNQPMDLIESAFTTIAGYLNLFESNESVLQSTSATYASWRDEQLKVDPMEAAIAFEESSRALQAFMSYVVFMVSMSQKFHEMTANVMM